MENSTAAQQVVSRIQECRRRAVHLYCDNTRPPAVHAVLEAYLYCLCTERILFLQAAIQYFRSRKFPLPEHGPLSLVELIVHPPARWEFEHVDVFGAVSDALCCARRYRVCSWFIAIHPVQSDDPLTCEREPMRIPIRHKPTSPWFQDFRRRNQLKNELGSRLRSLVGYARKMTKAEFLEQFAATPGSDIPMTDRSGRRYTIRRLIPDASPELLLTRTGYTPAEFWREVRNPNTRPARKPQLELSL